MKRLGIVALSVHLLASITACSVVGPGEMGVRVRLGAVSDEPQQSGPHLWLPFVYGMKKIDVRIQKTEIEETAASHDMQDVYAKLAINWSIDPKTLVDTYKRIGDEDAVEERILIPSVNEVMKSATSQRTAEEVLSKRMEMKKDIDDQLKERLAKNGIFLHDVSIVNLRFSEGFSHAIEQKQIAEQQAKQASYVAEKATQDAKAEIERAKGQAEAQRLLKQTLTSEILQARAIEKWKGEMPMYVGGSGALPFINLKDLQK